MDTFDRERELIKARIAEIKRATRSPEKNGHSIVIAAGEPVLDIYSDEYKALHRMAEIMEFGMRQTSRWEYVELRERTKLEAITEKDRDKLQDTSNIEEDKEADMSLASLTSPEDNMTLSNGREESMSETPYQPSAPLGRTRTRKPGPDVIDVEYEVLEDEPELPPRDQTHGEEPEELVEVETVTPWQWIKNHKKQILIALGITAITIAIVVAITQLWPAIVAASQATQVAGLAGEMVKNGALWHTAAAGEQAALHSANAALANMISGITGTATTYSQATGVWTIGGQALNQFAASSVSAATAATAKVSLLTNIASVAGVGGLGALGAGLIIPTKKSVQYKSIKKSIDNFFEASYSLTEEDQMKTAQMINNKILETNGLSDHERNILFKKLQRTLKKVQKQNKQQVQEPEFEVIEDNIVDFPEEQDLKKAM